MRPQLELFVRCLGLTLVVAGLLLGLDLVAGWLQPVPDLGAFSRSMEKVVQAPGGVQDDFFPWSIFEQGVTRAFVLRLITRGAAPLALGFFLLRFAGAIAALCCRGEPSVESTAAAEPAKPGAPAAGGGPHGEDPGRKYAPPGYLP
jgi:hypothetical protein